MSRLSSSPGRHAAGESVALARRRTARPALVILFGTMLGGCPASVDEIPAQNTNERAAAGFHVETLVEGLEHPWGLSFLPGDEGILITERPGRLRLVRGGILDPRPIDGVPEVRDQGEGGLLGLTLHPRFEDNRLVYLAYAKPVGSGSTTAVARGRLVDHRLEGVEDIFVADAWGLAAVNHGGRIAFDHDGLLFVTIGDRREAERAQDLRDHAGTVVRLHDDGRVPEDNPFVGRADSRPEIFTYGHRNPIGLLVHPERGEVWASENGPAGGDEVNRLVPGSDYGWPVTSFGTHYDGRPIPSPRPGDGTEPPVHYWVPGISPSGMAIYSRDAFPEWEGSIFSGSLQQRFLSRLAPAGENGWSEERLLEDLGMRIRDVAIGPDALIYLLVDSPDAPLLRISPAAP